MPDSLEARFHQPSYLGVLVSLHYLLELHLINFHQVDNKSPENATSTRINRY